MRVNNLLVTFLTILKFIYFKYYFIKISIQILSFKIITINNKLAKFKFIWSEASPRDFSVATRSENEVITVINLISGNFQD